MTEGVLTALISGGISLLGVILTCIVTARRSEHAVRVAQAITDTKIEELTREVREHNGFARRMPVLENEVDNIRQTLRELKSFHRGQAI